MNNFYIVLELIPGNGYSRPYGIFDDEDKAKEVAKLAADYTGNVIEIMIMKMNQAPSFKE